MNPATYLGQGPGRETGVAVWNARRQMFAREHSGSDGEAPPLVTLDFWRAYDLILTFDAGEKVETSTKFGTLLLERGFERIRKNDGKYYRGITLKPPTEL